MKSGAISAIHIYIYIQCSLLDASRLGQIHGNADCHLCSILKSQSKTFCPISNLHLIYKYDIIMTSHEHTKITF